MQIDRIVWVGMVLLSLTSFIVQTGAVPGHLEIPSISHPDLIVSLGSQSHQSVNALTGGMQVNLVKRSYLPRDQATRASCPVVSAINPTSGILGTSISFIATGKSFEVGAVMYLNRIGSTNILATGVRRVSSSIMFGTLTIPPEAAIGNWSVIVAQNGKVSNNNVLFSIRSGTPPAPEVIAVSPASGRAGTNVQFTLAGVNLRQGAAVYLVNTGCQSIIATNLTVYSPFTLKGTFPLDMNVRAGVWNLIVKQGGQYSSNSLPFTIISGTAPYVSKVTPQYGPRGKTVPFVLSGSSFKSGAAVSLNKAHQTQINAINITVSSNSRLNGSFSIPINACIGDWNLSVKQNNEVSNNEIIFTIIPWADPYVSSIAPSFGIKGTSTPFILKGSNFLPGASVNLSKRGYQNITGTGVNLISTTMLNGTLTIPRNTPVGGWNVTVSQMRRYSNSDVTFTIVSIESEALKGLMMMPDNNRFFSSFPTG